MSGRRSNHGKGTHTSLRRLASVVGVAVTVLLWARVAASQTTVTLNASARVQPDAAVHLNDLATIVGDDAQSIGCISVFESAASQCKGGNGWFEVSVGDIRSALEASHAILGRTTLRGATCVVRLSGSTVAPKTARAPIGSKQIREQQEPTTVDTADAPTVRTILALTLARFLGVNAENLKIGFDAKDETLLSKPTEGKRVDVQPAASALNEQIPVRIYIYSGDKLLSSDTITVKALVRRTMLSAAQAIDRKTTIDAGMLTTGQSWVSPNTPMTCTMEQALGAVARANIRAGQPILAKQIDTPLLIHRGDTVEIHCLSGSVTLKAARARALGAGREGEYVSFQLIGSKKTFTARVSGRGLAIIVVGEVPLQASEKQDDRTPEQ